jgi:hypothetical protein
LRFVKEPRVLASALDRKHPARITAWLMVMTVGVLVDAAWAYRIRQTRKAPQATLPPQQGHPLHKPTARWGFQDCVGIHLLRMPGQGALVLKLHAQPQQLLRPRGHPSEACCSRKGSGLGGMSV